jgi:hypothetical protein
MYYLDSLSTSQVAFASAGGALQLSVILYFIIIIILMIIFNKSSWHIRRQQLRYTRPGGRPPGRLF